MADNQAEIEDLEKKIKFYQDDYYQGGQQISDAEFDKMWDRLTYLDPNNPILQKVGSDLEDDEEEELDGFAKAKHLIPMGSQKKAANPEAFLEWADEHRYPEFLVQYKLDGASLELQYDEGKFVKAVTRGDGVMGDAVTVNVSKMQGVQKTLKDPFTGGVRGEVLMFHGVKAEHYSEKANCRNAATGVMKRKDGTGSEHLHVIVYDATSTEGDEFADELEKIDWLKEMGFDVVQTTVLKTPEEVIQYRAKVMDDRKNLEFDIDGLVIKNNDIDQADLAKARPDKQIAFKFSLDEAITDLKSVFWSEKGATYTPVAQVTPVALCGTTVKQANLCNPNLIKNLNLMVGSRVVITKRGEIIPKIESLVENPAGCTPIDIPTKCATCGADLVNGGSKLYCPNPACDKKGIHQILKWISALSLMDIGPAIVKRLYAEGLVTSIYGLYQLKASDVARLDRMGDSSAANIVKNRDAIKKVSLPKFVDGFDIPDIGETYVTKLMSAGYDSLDKLLKLRVSEIAGLPGIGQITAEKIVRGLADNKDEMLKVAAECVEIDAPKTGGKLAGKSFCFTGVLGIKRAEAEKMVVDAGGTAASSVSKTLSYLVTNETDPTGKYLKAQQLGIPIVSEDEFLAMLN